MAETAVSMHMEGIFLSEKNNYHHPPVTVPSWVFKIWPRRGYPIRQETFTNARLEDELFRQISASGQLVRLSLHDCAAERWIEYRAKSLFYPASMIKTLLLLTALEKAGQGKFLLKSPYLLRESDKYAGIIPVAGTGILQFAVAGSSYTLEDLLFLMIAQSDNVATNIIFEQIGSASCAATAKRLGLKNSIFSRKLYDLESGQPSNRATARDLTRMLLAMHNRAAAGEKLTRKGIEMMAATVDKSRIGRLIGGRALVANKVGTVSNMVGDMALLYFPHRPPLALTIVVEHPPDQKKAAHLIGTLAANIVQRLAPER